MAFDKDTIEQFAAKDEIYFQINDWVNKTLNIRDVAVFFDEEGKYKPDQMISLWAPARGYADFMTRYFPWLDFEHIETEETLGFEVEVHTLYVSVNDLGKAYLAVEEYFTHGSLEPTEPLVSDSELSDTNSQEELIRRVINRD